MAREKTKGKVGQPPLWDVLDMPSKLECVTGWMKQGSTDKELAEMLGCSTTTIYKWKNEYPAFAEALKKGKHVANGELINSAFKTAVGYYYTEERALKVKVGPEREEVRIVEVTCFAKPDATMAIFMLKNRLPDEYRDRKHVEHAGILKHEHTEARERLAGKLDELAERRRAQEAS